MEKIALTAVVSVFFMTAIASIKILISVNRYNDRNLTAIDLVLIQTLEVVIFLACIGSIHNAAFPVKNKTNNLIFLPLESIISTPVDDLRELDSFLAENNNTVVIYDWESVEKYQTEVLNRVSQAGLLSKVHGVTTRLGNDFSSAVGVKLWLQHYVNNTERLDGVVILTDDLSGDWQGLDKRLVLCKSNRISAYVLDLMSIVIVRPGFEKSEYEKVNTCEYESLKEINFGGQITQKIQF